MVPIQGCSQKMQGAALGGNGRRLTTTAIPFFKPTAPLPTWYGSSGRHYRYVRISPASGNTSARHFLPLWARRCAPSRVKRKIWSTRSPGLPNWARKSPLRNTDALFLSWLPLCPSISSTGTNVSPTHLEPKQNPFNVSFGVSDDDDNRTQNLRNLVLDVQTRRRRCRLR